MAACAAVAGWFVLARHSGGEPFAVATVATDDQTPRLRHELPGWLPGLIGTVVILIAWQLIAVLWGGEKHVVASPTEIWQGRSDELGTVAPGAPGARRRAGRAV